MASLLGAVTSLLGLSSVNFVINPSGFNSPVYSTSAGGRASCISGYIPVTTSAQTSKIGITTIPNQQTVTEFFVQYLSVNSTLPASAIVGQQTTSGTYNINAKLCYPIAAKSPDAYNSILFLIHGIGFAKNYWDIASGYSFVDAAADAGYPTFSYDRLGTGLSDHPDPIQVVQSTLQVNIAHSLIQSLRGGKLSNKTFSKVAGAGHSYGSIQSVGIAAQYPTDLDAIVLQGFSLSSSGLPITFADFTSAIANQNVPARLGALQNGYLVTSNPIANQFAFYTYPNYDQSIFNSLDAKKEPFSVGDALTLTAPVVPATAYTGSIDVVLGGEDVIFCQGDCLYPVDQAAAVQPVLFPNANSNSDSDIVNGVGHAVNAHYGAQSAFAQMIQFYQRSGI